MPKCSFKNCKNVTSRTLKKDGISYFSFPRDPIRCGKWTSIVSQQRQEEFFKPNKSSVVCSKHFFDEDMYVTAKSITRILKTAIPRVDVTTAEDPIIGSSNLRVNEESDSSNIVYGGGGIDSSGEYSDFDDEQAEREAGGDDTPRDEHQIEEDQDEADYDVCKVETVEHTFTDEEKSQFVPASKNMPEVNMFAVVEYITNNVKEFKQLNFTTLKSLTKNNPYLISSPLVLQCASSYRVRATVSLDRGTSHMCEVEYDTDTDTVANSECLCGADVCQHTAAFLMWLHTRPLTTSTLTSTDTLAGGKSAEPKLRKCQVSDSGKESKPSANAGPSTSRGGGRGEQPPAKRHRVAPDVEAPVPVTPVVPDTAITVVLLPKDEDEPDKSKIQCTFPRKTIYTLWKNMSGTSSERSQQIQSTLRSKLQDDEFVTDFMPIEQRVQRLCALFEDMKDELHKPEYSEFMNLRETLDLDRVSIGKGGSLRDPLT